MARSSYDKGGELALKQRSRRQPCRKNRAEPEGEQAGPGRVSNELHRRGLRFCPGGVRSLWLRHDLQSFAWRLQAPEAQGAQPPDSLLTEAPGQAREKARPENEAGGEIETAPPGYRGAQDTSSVGTSKSSGRISQQILIDTYSQGAVVKRYNRQKALRAADLLKDRDNWRTLSAHHAEGVLPPCVPQAAVP